MTTIPLTCSSFRSALPGPVRVDLNGLLVMSSRRMPGLVPSVTVSLLPQQPSEGGPWLRDIAMHLTAPNVGALIQILFQHFQKELTAKRLWRELMLCCLKICAGHVDNNELSRYLQAPPPATRWDDAFVERLASNKTFKNWINVSFDSKWTALSKVRMCCLPPMFQMLTLLCHFEGYA